MQEVFPSFSQANQISILIYNVSNHSTFKLFHFIFIIPISLQRFYSISVLVKIPERLHRSLFGFAKVNENWYVNTHLNEWKPYLVSPWSRSLNRFLWYYRQPLLLMECGSSDSGSLILHSSKGFFRLLHPFPRHLKFETQLSTNHSNGITFYRLYLVEWVKNKLIARQFHSM